MLKEAANTGFQALQPRVEILGKHPTAPDTVGGGTKSLQYLLGAKVNHL